MHHSLEALGAAAAALEVRVSPQMARGVQVTGNTWRDLTWLSYFCAPLHVDAGW
ncbi:hypothetical protein [Paenarthrobacter sp. PH39-S1]|uniref:hypothetical protein n=1 Tax=Paenarthrobacter sp. PH39-S1 TaxID=3046204 RepID=UPI0024BB486E|nr:hypothetical protein [Paenarthrobacter sp. PH39-S1]MDJ0356199.1 hypothetical protein [Paenarthrobacter sp. PH39-S1]